ncbi:MAG: TolC family protein [Pseudomonadota bacterium]
MNKKNMLFIFLLVSLIAVATEDINKTTNLDDAIIATLKNNPDIEQAKQKVKQAKASYKEVLGSLWPSLSAKGIYTKYNKSIDLEMPDFEALLSGATDYDTVTRTMQPGHSFGASATATMLLLSAQVYPGISSSKISLEISKISEKLTKQAIVYVCTNMFLRTLGAKKLSKISETSLKAANDNLNAAKLRFKNGAITKIELIRSEILEGQAKLSLIKAKEDFNHALKSLSILMGEKANEPFDIDYTNPVVPTFENSTIIAFNNRSDYKIAQESVVLAKKLYQVQVLSFFPTLSAQGSYNIQDVENFNGDYSSWQGMLILNWDLFNGFSTSAKVSKAKAYKIELENSLESLKRNIEQEVSLALSQLKKAQSQIDISKKQVMLAELNKDASKTAYEKGALSNLDFIDAFDKWVSASFLHTATEIELMIAKSNLEKALGTINVPEISGKW